MGYKWCAVHECKNTTIKTPNKLFVTVPRDAKRRKKWFELGRRNVNKIQPNTAIYFCEDHFNLENDMDNYMEYKVMGSVKQIRMKPNCVPSRFDCRRRHPADDKHNIHPMEMSIPQTMSTSSFHQEIAKTGDKETPPKGIGQFRVFISKAVQAQVQCRKMSTSTSELSSNTKKQTRGAPATATHYATCTCTCTCTCQCSKQYTNENDMEIQQNKRSRKQKLSVREDLKENSQNVQKSSIVEQTQTNISECYSEALHEDEIQYVDIKLECEEEFNQFNILEPPIKREPGVTLSEQNDRVCRTCLCPCEADGAVTLHERDEDLDATLGCLLAEVAGVVEHDQLPRVLCDACSRSLRAAAAFRRRAIRADTTLRDKPRRQSLDDQANYLSEHLVCAPSLKDLFQLKDEPTVSPQREVETNKRTVSPQFKEEPNKPNAQPETDSDNFYWSGGEQEKSPQRETRKRKIQLNTESSCSSDSESKRIERSSRRNKVRDGSWEPSDGDTDCHSSTDEHMDETNESFCSKKQKKQKNKDVARPRKNTALIPKKKQRRNKEKKVQCFECGWMTVYKYRLDIHMRKHTNERAYKCSECGQQFKHLCSLKIHLQMHKPKSERARKFICDICGRDFYKKYYMIQHLAKHSNPQFVCQSCGHAFAWRQNLKAHQMRVHGEQIVK